MSCPLCTGSPSFTATVLTRVAAAADICVSKASMRPLTGTMFESSICLE